MKNKNRYIINNVKIRRANIKDLNNILKLNFDLFKKEYNEFDKSLNLEWTYKNGKKYFKSRIIKKDGFVEVAEVGGKIVGYLCGGIYKRKYYRKKAKCAELENMLIMAKFRGKGIGRKLVENFVNWCKKSKVEYIKVTAFAENKQAMDFYRKLGFRDYELDLEMKIQNRKL